MAGEELICYSLGRYHFGVRVFPPFAHPFPPFSRPFPPPCVFCFFLVFFCLFLFLMFSLDKTLFHYWLLLQHLQQHDSKELLFCISSLDPIQSAQWENGFPFFWDSEIFWTSCVIQARLQIAILCPILWHSRYQLWQGLACVQWHLGSWKAATAVWISVAEKGIIPSMIGGGQWMHERHCW